MKAVLMAASLCGLAASARAADPPDSWAVLSSRPQAPFVERGNGPWFATDSDWRSFKHDDRDRKPWGDHDDDKGMGFNHGEFGDDGGDDLEKCMLPSPVPEPPTWLALALGATTLGFVRAKKMHQD